MRDLIGDLRIETDGTAAGTKVFSRARRTVGSFDDNSDGRKLFGIRRIRLSASVQAGVRLEIESAWADTMLNGRSRRRAAGRNNKFRFINNKLKEIQRMKCKKLTIETDGTTANTKIFADGEQVGFVQRFELAAEMDDPFVKIMMIQIVKGGKMKTRKIRDEKSLKFVEKQVAETKSILVEFER